MYTSQPFVLYYPDKTHGIVFENKSYIFKKLFIVGIQNSDLVISL